MLDFRMDTFLAVCRHRNYTRAAEELNITQPAVTQHIQYLQSYYGVKLFSYQNKRLALTEEGELLRNAALCMLHDEEKLKRDVKDLRLGRRSIRFGATLTIGEYLLPERLAAYMKRNPRVDVHMLVENTQILLRMINDGELDFAVVEGYFRKSEYDYIIWSQEPYVCVCAAAHPLAQAAPHPAQPGLRLPGCIGAGAGGAQPPRGRFPPHCGNQRPVRHQGAGQGRLRHHLPLPQGGGEGAGRGLALPGSPHGLPDLP